MAGTFKIITPVNIPPNLTIVGVPGQTFVQQAVIGDSAAFLARSTLSGTTGLIKAINTRGSNKVLSNTNYAAGTWLYLDSAAEGGGNIYKVASSTASGGNWILTLDRPVLWVFAISDVITPITTLTQNVHISGITFSGTATGVLATGYVGFAFAYRCSLTNCVGNAALLSTGGVVFNFDIGCLECRASDVKVDRGGSAPVGASLRSNERCQMDGTFLNCAVYGVVLFDDINCSADVAAQGNGTGVALTSGVSASVTGCTRCDVRIVSTGDVVGVNVAFSSSDNTIDCNIVDSSNMGVAVGYNNGPCLRNEIHRGDQRLHRKHRVWRCLLHQW